MKKKNLYSGFEKREFPFIYLLIAFPVLQFAVFWAFVNFNSIMLAFKDATGTFTLDNFSQVFEAISGEDGYGFNLLDIIGRSLTLWSISTLFAFPIGLATTYVLFRRVCGHYVYRICYLLPSLVGGVIWVAMVKQLAEYNGPIIYLLSKIGVKFHPTVLNQGLFAHESTAFPTLCIMTFVLGFVGGNAVLTGAYSRIPSELYEVGRLDGIGFWTEFFRVAIPCVWSTIATLITFSLCSIFIADGNVFLYSNGTGEPGMATVGYYLYFLVYRLSISSAVNLPYGYPAALGICITVITVPIVLVGRWLLDKVTDTVET